MPQSFSPRVSVDSFKLVVALSAYEYLKNSLSIYVLLFSKQKFIIQWMCYFLPIPGSIIHPLSIEATYTLPSLLFLSLLFCFYKIDCKLCFIFSICHVIHFLSIFSFLNSIFLTHFCSYFAIHPFCHIHYYFFECPYY